MRKAAKALLWFAPAALLACAVTLQSKAPRVLAEVPRPTMNHALHAERDLLCADCHDPEETGDPKLPAPESCFECHETDLTQEGERVQAYFAAVRQPDGSYRFERPEYHDLIVAHKHHAEYDVACADCHGEPTEKAFARPAPLDLKRTCMGCHEERGASNACATCHVETRKDAKPASHDAGFLAAHGAQAPEGWREGEGASCALCHEVPDSCNACHQASKPRSHAEAGFRLFHGRGDTDARDEPFAETSCALCHEENSCVRCHQVEKPRNHTAAFERRLHGVAASIERQSCATCHKQDSCMQCHQTTRPLSHRGNFGSGSQAHCIHCHDPLPGTGCFTCHKSTLGHLTATPLPPGPPHAGAADPSACLSCHLVLPHFDDGGSCRRCHR